jgi:hypothetical protein
VNETERPNRLCFERLGLEVARHHQVRNRPCSEFESLTPSQGRYVSSNAAGFAQRLRASDAKEEEDNDEITNVDVGVVVGAGMTFDRLVIEARYSFGLTDVRGAEFEDKAQNRVFSVLAGVRF